MKEKIKQEIREVGENVPKNIEEQEEDFLEVIYRHWQNGESMQLMDFVIDMNEEKTHLRSLTRRLINHKYIELKGKDVIVLTDFGKRQGRECLERHEKLTQFFQMISGMSQDEAAQDACRVEHTISKAGMAGITNFLIYGDVYDRTYTNMDLSTLYENGTYIMAMEIYEIERRAPRVLSKEWRSFAPYVKLEIAEGDGTFYLQKKEKECSYTIWYRQNEEWVRLREEEGCVILPSRLFQYTVSAEAPVTEAYLTVSITEGDRSPVVLDCREINIHVI